MVICSENVLLTYLLGMANKKDYPRLKAKLMTHNVKII